MRTLGIIPARANSQRLPGKNLAMCGGKPLLQWTVEAAERSGLYRRYVSTDCIDIAALCEERGWPYRMRDPEIDGDIPIQRVIDWHMQEKFDCISTHVVLLQPTSPLRSTADIDACLAILDDGADSVASYTDIGKHQELLTTNGAIFACRREYAGERLLRGPNHRVYLMPRERSIDIDTAADLELAERMLRMGK